MDGATSGLLIVARRRTKSLPLGIRWENEGIAADSRGSAAWLDSNLHMGWQVVTTGSMQLPWLGALAGLQGINGLGGLAVRNRGLRFPQSFPAILQEVADGSVVAAGSLTWNCEQTAQSLAIRMALRGRHMESLLPVHQCNLQPVPIFGRTNVSHENTLELYLGWPRRAPPHATANRPRSLWSHDRRHAARCSTPPPSSTS